MVVREISPCLRAHPGIPLAVSQAENRLGTVINVSSVPQLSPFRYPGGKTWLIPYIRAWLNHLDVRPSLLVEPFAGGASVGLTAVFEQLTDAALLIELDNEVAAVWETVLGDSSEELVERIATFEMSKAAIATLLSTLPTRRVDLAFATLVKNRTRYGGILADGAAPMRNGEDGRGLLSRWYPTTLQRRIRAIAALRDRFLFVQGDALSFLENAPQGKDIAYFIDPPYTVAGRRLYTHSEMDHERLFELASKLKGDMLITYDDAPEIALLASKHGLDVERIPMQGTKLSKKTELLIGRDLGWTRARANLSPQLVADALFEGSERDGDSCR